MVIKITVVTEVVIMTSFSKNTLTTDHSQGSYSQLLRCFLTVGSKQNLICICFALLGDLFCTVVTHPNNIKATKKETKRIQKKLYFKNLSPKNFFLNHKFPK